MNATPDRGMNDKTVLLVDSYCNGTLSGDQWNELERLLLADSEARAYFRRFLALDAALRDFAGTAAEHWVVESRRPPANKYADSAGSSASNTIRPRWARPLWAAAIAAFAAGVFAALALVQSNLSSAKEIASLEQVTGDVRVFTSNGQVRTLVTNGVIRPGETVQTNGSRSATVVAYPDGTRLTLVGNTSATCGDLHSKSFVIHHGTLAASVEPQPTASPLVLATPTAQVEVLGTKFLLEAVAKRTNLSVTEGRVRLVRVRDGAATEVAEGMRAIVSEQAKLLVEDSPQLPDRWDVDFEAGRLDGWEIGEFVTENLPPRSHGAIRAARHDGDDGQTYYSIASESAWSQGLFAIGKDSHFHVTLKMENPKWLNLFLVTRTADPQNPRFSSNFIFKEFSQVEPDKWLTISIPLAEFRKLHDGPETIDQLIPYHVIFNSTAPDRGLVIDRIWVTPDGPGDIRIREVE